MLKIRLRRMGARNNPFYRVVVSDSRNVPTASALEEIGYYDVTKNPAQVNIDRERAEHWISRGAQVSPTVKRLLQQAAKVAKSA
jgi:small subunit ribosomal protein S16